MVGFHSCMHLLVLRLCAWPAHIGLLQFVKHIDMDNQA